MSDILNFLADTLRLAQSAGADAVDLLHVSERSRSVRVRHGKVESVDAAETAQLGLRVFIGKCQAMVAGTDLQSTAMRELVDRAVSMARLSPEDPYCGLADPSEISRAHPPLDMFDPSEQDAATLLRLTQEMEAAAMAVPGVSQADEMEGGWSASSIHLLQSNGFSGSYRRSHSGFSAAVIAGQDTSMERDYDYSSAVYFSDLLPPQTIGKRAGERAVKRLGARKMPTGKIPVVFEARIAASLVSHFTSAINGAAVARGTTFLKEKLGQRLFPAGFRVMDDPHLVRGMRSRPFDAEGLPTKPCALVDDGILTTWLLDLRSSRQLAMRSTGHAGRGTSSPPHPSASNTYFAAGALTPDALIKDIKTGFYVTELIGMGVNGVTGDYSRGASGFWIENGVITHPVNEMTIAGNLLDMFAALTAANDLELRRDRESPTLRIEGMTVAGL